MNDLVQTLASVVDQLEASKESGKENRRKAKALTEALRVLDEFPLSETDRAVTCAIQDLADELESAGGGKTDATNKACNRVRGLVEAEILPDDEQVIAQELVEKYQKLGGGGNGGTRVNSGVTTPDFPFAIAVMYEGKVIARQGMKKGVYWNSIRHECRKFERETLGHADLTGNGEWKEAKKALENGAVSVQAGLFTLTKAA